MPKDNAHGRQVIAGPHVEAGQKKFGEAIGQGGDGLRDRDPTPLEDLVDQDTASKHPQTGPHTAPGNGRTPHQDAQHGADVRGDPTGLDTLAAEPPEGLQRTRKDPLNKSSGRRPPPADK
mgnify:CR=1 FL=1